MTRGRKKDLTIPPTRALVQQRDYRARKAHYIADLEERVRKAEAENVQLRSDLEAARAELGVPPILVGPQAAEVSRELMQHLTLATNSLSRFQQLVFPEQLTPTALLSAQPPPPSGLSSQLRPASFPSPAPSPPYYSQATQQPTFRPALHSSSAHLPSSLPPLTPSYAAGRKRLHREDSPDPQDIPHFEHHVTPPLSNQRCTLSPESECCGGILDCQDLIESEDENEEKDRPLDRSSRVRSTSEHPYGYYA